MCEGLAELQARVLGGQESAGVWGQAGDEARLVLKAVCSMLGSLDSVWGQ